ncbi:MAG: hypothetical protein AAGI23_03655 [Bacteroidota bacterium]
MKNLMSILLFQLFILATITAQNTMTFNYQAVVRNDDGSTIVNQDISIQIDILSTTAQGDIIYTEQHLTTTDDLGGFTLPIGQGEVFMGEFRTIDWGADEHYIRLSTDLEGGENFQELGTFQLQAVPYALYGKDEDADPTNESIESIDLQGNTLVIQESGRTQSVDLSALMGSENTDNQTLNFSGTQLSISGGNSINLASLQDGTEDADADPGNELQTLSFDAENNALSLSSSNTIILPISESPWSVTSNNSIAYTGETASIQNPLGRNYLSFGNLDGQGGLTTFANNGFPLASLRNNGNGKGRFNLYGNRSVTTLPPLVAFVDNSNSGSIILSDESEQIKANIYTQNGSGHITLNDENTAMVDLGKAEELGGHGYLLTFGPNGNRNNFFGSLIGFPNNGYVTAIDANNEIQAGIYVDDRSRGIVFGDIKNFRVPHPKQKGKEIWYASLEGPEAGAYERGTARLKNGEAFIPYSEHFQLMIDPTTTTFSLTPFSADTYGLAVVERTSEGFKVKELNGGNSNFEFSWQVTAVRKGYEDYEVIRDAKSAQPAMNISSH